MSTLAERLIHRLEKTGENPSSASIEAGLGISAIRDIIIGKSKAPTLATVEALCGPLDCSLAYLVGIDQSEVSPELQPIGRFWMVYGVGQRGPSYRHWSVEAATAEAHRLSTVNPGIIFVVLEAVAAFRAESPRVTELGIVFDADDGIPF